MWNRKGKLKSVNLLDHIETDLKLDLLKERLINIVDSKVSMMESLQMKISMTFFNLFLMPLGLMLLSNSSSKLDFILSNPLDQPLLIVPKDNSKLKKTKV